MKCTDDSPDIPRSDTRSQVSTRILGADDHGDVSDLPTHMALLTPEKGHFDFLAVTKNYIFLICSLNCSN